jgi:hypothetical protein
LLLSEKANKVGTAHVFLEGSLKAFERELELLLQNTSYEISHLLDDE